MNFGRSPILIIVALFLLLFILLPLLSKRSSTSLTDTDRALRTHQTLQRVTSAESTYLAKHGKYAGHIADLVPLQPTLATDLTDGVVTIQIDSSGDKAYVVQILSSVLSYTWAFENGKRVANNCLQLKSAGKTYCPRKTSQIQKTLPAT